LTHTLAGWHSPVGQRHFVARRLKSAPAKVQTPCRQHGGLCSPRSVRLDSLSDVTGQMPRSMQPSWIGPVLEGTDQAELVRALESLSEATRTLAEQLGAAD
jgi:hypothetical protein